MKQAARRIGVSESRLRYALGRGYIPYYWVNDDKNGRRLYFSPEQVDAYKQNLPYRSARAKRWKKQAYG